MRRRARRQLKAFLISLTVAGSLVFFFNDGTQKGQRASWTPFVSVTKAQGLGPLLATSENAAARLRKEAVPQGFHPVWKTQTLDHGRISVQVLEHPYTIGQSRDGLGSEYFQYAAFLFKQIASQEPALTERLKVMSVHAQAMGDALQTVGALRYDGPPREDMEHLQARKEILGYLDSLITTPVIQTTYNQNGKLLKAEAPPKAHSADTLASFLQTSDALLRHPVARQYPETMRLIRQERDWLKNISEHLVLRSDSTVYCHKQCSGLATHVAIYAHQTLPANTKAELMF